ncbi:thiamine pyrophosphate-dependent dehydrogenase E1 component subunit alpha [Conexibacter sp. JD483]|uniref:thiamine pyrophosphate-dependent dehydrogenase E1 component subunit alpha n=1 Tax=unclassified Conexibacter TaxID=2627773 RepID=UPI0027163019|nr:MULTISPECIES: thiamine pyrophosphate-dependent dehydrogenase E1 component subunit alpha [unclassified Conexibacter]MDO8188369.1 thiamine pyrophosphate-dependent dehydrogenase E1 component subunit alpha [Conexibacter sp. CPCC 205706]MDO8201115.1 thiamine pyrophosphate-dependent dehydrogenase E1 component subunit alpha [Conexibacter sp. CPCC 205762]MDR9371585.1 thiamine pyrophosphate-dependent dehydrogenase E1 component subunit alpha [Conexibacter sp. JD483]
MARASEAPAASELSGPAQHGLELYRRMLVVRRFEEAVQALFQRGEVHGTTHLYIGEEAGAIGVCDVLDERDKVAGTYRGHGHSLGAGVDPQALLDEMLGRETGVCGGRAGSMNVIDQAHGLIGSFGIIGGSISAATGAALALQRQGRGGVAVAFFGEGTTNHGYFHECLNFAAVLRLPVVFVCENNRYGEFTPFEDVTAGDIAARPQALGLPTETVDGMDVWAVREAAAAAVARARDGEGPQFIQSMTYRFVGHSRSDPAKYRKPGELEEWKARDPLKVARERLAEAFGVSGDVVDGVDAAVAEQFERIVAQSLAAPYPTPERDGAREFAPSTS